MIVYLTETEKSSRDIFTDGLPGHDVRFADGMDGIGDDAEVFSGFIYSEIDEPFLAAHPRLRLVATRSSAIEHIDVAACGRRGVTVCNVPMYGATTVAEHTLALILALSRRLREIMFVKGRSRFSYEQTRAFDLAGKTLGIVGLGRIGRHVARLGRAFEMRVLATDVAPPDAAECEGVECVELDALLAESHIVSLHASLTPKTYHMINRETLARCRPGVIIINTARGSLIDTAALRDALESGHVGGAGLDVLEDERILRDTATHIITDRILAHLRSDALASESRDADRLRELEELMLGDAVLARSNVVFTPHVAFNSIEAVNRLRLVTVENIAAFAAGKPVNVVGGAASTVPG